MGFVSFWPIQILLLTTLQDTNFIQPYHNNDNRNDLATSDHWIYISCTGISLTKTCAKNNVQTLPARRTGITNNNDSEQDTGTDSSCKKAVLNNCLNRKNLLNRWVDKITTLHYVCFPCIYHCIPQTPCAELSWRKCHACLPFALFHDNDMMTSSNGNIFRVYWPFVRGIHRSPVNSSQKGQWRGALMFSLNCVWINGWVNDRGAGDFRRYRTHYDVIVMITQRLLCQANCNHH